MSAANVTSHALRRPGLASSLRLTIDLVDWLDARRHPPHWSVICERYEISRATAFRWLQAYRDARGRWSDAA